MTTQDPNASGNNRSHFGQSSVSRRLLACFAFALTLAATGDAMAIPLQPEGEPEPTYDETVVDEPPAPVVVPSPPPPPQPPAAQADDPLIIISDPARYARAFADGPVGAPPESLPSSSLAGIRENPPDPEVEPEEPPSTPPPNALVTVAAAPDAINVAFQCGPAGGGSHLLRVNPDGYRTVIRNGLGLCVPGSRRNVRDAGLQPQTRYCYEFSYASQTVSSCATTRRLPFAFEHAEISQTESDDMAARFDWRLTDPVLATMGGEPTLYAMKILVTDANDLYGLRGLGIHTQSEPIFEEEKDTWSGQALTATSAEGRPLGAWISALVPGAVYNDLRAQAIDTIARGNSFGIQAMVFQRVAEPEATHFPANRISPLRVDYLAREGIEYNGRAAVTCHDGYCEREQALFGWLANKFISFAVEVVDSAVGGVRRAFGFVYREVKGEADLNIQFVLNNADPDFGTNELTRSGWKGTPLLLKGLPVRVYQGLAQFNGRSNENGTAKVAIAKNRKGKVCVVLENDKVKIVESFIAREVCVGRFEAISSSQDLVLQVNDGYANQLAAITDAADYIRTVMNFNMPQVSVLTGWQSSILGRFNDQRSFAPCMGRLPNVALAPVFDLTPLAPIAEFLNSYDIVLNGSDVNSRGVGVHEYGHTLMCELLRDKDQVAAATAWADVILASLSGQGASMHQSVIAEGFADFLALQVIGGTNYFAGRGTVQHGEINYCQGASSSSNDCLEDNQVRCEGAGCDFRDNVHWVVSVLQDVFDRVPADAAEKTNPPVEVPNDGSHWQSDSNHILQWHHASNQVSDTEGDAVHLPGAAIRDIFQGWDGATLTYQSFFGGVAKALKQHGFPLAESCAMYQAHEPGATCPDYFVNAHNAAEAPPPDNGPQPVPDPQPDPDPIPAGDICVLKPWSPGCRDGNPRSEQ